MEWTQTFERHCISQTFAMNTFRFAIFSSKKPFPTRVFIHRKFFNHFMNIFVKKIADFFNISKYKYKNVDKFYHKNILLHDV